MPAHQGRKEPLTIPTALPAHMRPASRAAGNASPITPAVTGIHYPTTSMYSTTETETTRYRTQPNRLYTHPNVCGSAIDDGATVTDSQVAREDHIQQIWGQIRQQKEQKMAKERPKVESFEKEKKIKSPTGGNLGIGESQEIDIPVLDAPGPRLKRKKSMYVHPDFNPILWPELNLIFLF
jgi:hypothetical protein